MEATNTAEDKHLAEIKSGDHLILIHRTSQHWRRVVPPFLAEGLRRGERVFYLGFLRGPLQVCDMLLRENVDVNQAVDQSQLIFLDAERVFLRQGVFDPERVLGKYIASTQRAISQGFPGLRATVEMAWASSRQLDHHLLLEFEMRLHRDFFPHYQCTGLCQYDQALFPTELLDQLASLHPHVMRET